MTLTGATIERIATEQGMATATVIPGVFSESEYISVRIKFGVTAMFLMNNETFEYTYSHTYNAITDKTSKRKPKGF